MSQEPLIAVFVDFENLALGVRDMRDSGGEEFQISLVLKRLLEKGRLVFKRAYCDWSNYRNAVREFHSQGIELIDIPQSKASGKNSADIHMVVDALDLCYAKTHIDIFALISGDSDFSPLVSKLKENNKRVVGCGVKSSTSNLFIANCDEFIYYDDLVRNAQKSKPVPKRASRKREIRRSTRSRKPSTACWRPSARSNKTTIRSGDRWSSRPSAASGRPSTRATTATAASPNCWRTPSGWA